jgi:hypothetical protein
MYHKRCEHHFLITPFLIPVQAHPGNFLITITKKESHIKITYEIPQELNISNKNSLMLVVLLSKYTRIFLTVMMVINNKLKLFRKLNLFEMKVEAIIHPYL